jgi:hypothetical protein
VDYSFPGSHFHFGNHDFWQIVGFGRVLGRVSKEIRKGEQFMEDLSNIEKFTERSIWEFKGVLEVALSEMGIKGMVPGAYDLNEAFVIAVRHEQDKAREYLKSIENNDEL